MRKNRFHMLRPNDMLGLQNDFIFFDTESLSTKINNNEMHTLKLGYACHWNRITNKEVWLFFEDNKTFFDFIENVISDLKEVYLFAHNMDFDFKLVNGLQELSNRKWILDKFYINGTIFSLSYIKNNKKLIILDTCNYIPQKLEKIGESLGHKKMHINFEKCTNEELKIYCKNDVEIILLFIKKLLEFLNTYELTKLRNTTSSLALNSFRHKFYDYHKYPIMIHINKGAIKLERESYHGAISDCFKIGKINETLYKYDINSMYPYQMFKYSFPTKLIAFLNSGKNLKTKLLNNINKYHIIAKCVIYLPEEYAYILTKIKKDKCGFLSGKFEITITTPEIEFILKYGSIISVSEMAIYDKAPVFKEYVDFFYKKRYEFKDNKNFIFEQIVKLFLNGLYGKFGQHNTNYEIISNDAEYDLGKYEIVEEKNGEIKEYLVMHVGNNLVKIENNEDNSFDGFVAIASMVTAYARMYLVELILKIGRENIYYVDTDSFIVNKKGSDILTPYLDERKLGYLKFEGKSKNSEFIRPKWYTFNNETKCKGVKKIHDMLINDENELVVSQDQWERFKTSLKNKRMGSQFVMKTIKHMDKHYDKGIIKNGIVFPFKSDEKTIFKGIPPIGK